MEHIKTFEELSKKYNSYSEFKTVAFMKQNKLPKIFSDVIPEYCRCGAEFIMNENTINSMQCVDTNCPYKLSYGLSYFIESMGFKGFGDESSKKLVFNTMQDYPYGSYLYAFQIDDSTLFNILGESQGGLFREIRETLRTTRYKFSQTFGALGIQGMGKDSKLLNYVKSPSGLLKLVQEEDKLTERLEAMGLIAPTYKTALIKSIPSIAMLYLVVAPLCAEEGNLEVVIAITGEVSVSGVSYSRKEFIALCEGIKNNNNQPVFKIKESKSRSKIEYVIADSPSNSEKYRIGEELSCIITADDFVKKLQTMANSAAL